MINRTYKYFSSAAILAATMGMAILPAQAAVNIIRTLSASGDHDNSVAAGPNNVVTSNNYVIDNFDRSGNLVLEQDLTEGGLTNICCDSHILWDETVHRWVWTAVGGLGNCIAMSATTDPTAAWTGFSFTTNGNWCDGTNTGCNADAYYIWSGNAGVKVIKKSDLANGVFTAQDYPSFSGRGGVIADAKPGDPIWSVDINGGANPNLTVYRYDNVLTTMTKTSTVIPISTPGASGLSFCNWLYGRNNQLVVTGPGAKGTTPGSRYASQWWFLIDVSTSTPRLLQQGVVSMPPGYQWVDYLRCVLDPAGDIGIIYALGGPNGEALYVSGHSASDPPNTMQTPIAVASSAMWGGDFDDMSVDVDANGNPVNSFWGELGLALPKVPVANWSVTPNAVAPGTPSGLTATGNTTGNQLNWPMVSSATTYNVYRGTSPGGEGATPIATGLMIASYLDTPATPGVTYYYKIVAINSLGTSGTSSEVAAIAPQIFANGTYKFTNAAGFALDNHNGGGAGTGVDQVAYSGTNQKWTITPATGCEYKIVSANGYALTASTPSAQLTLQSYSRNANQLWFLQPNAFGYNIVNVGTGQGMDDWGGGLGVAVGLYTADSTNSNQNWGITPSATPVAPSSLTATAGTTQIALSWPAVSGATSYQIYRGTASYGESATPIASVTSSSYSDSGVMFGPTYYYLVVAVNSSGLGPASNEVSAVPVAPATVANGTYPLLSSASTYLDDPNGGGSGTGLDQVAVYTGVNQQWTVTLVSGNQYEITAANGLALTGARTDAQLVLQAYTGAPEQLWTFTPSSASPQYYLIENTGNNVRIPQAIDDWGGSGIVGQWTWSSVPLTNILWALNPTPISISIAAPTGLGAIGCTTAVSLSWSAAPGATSYNIYRGTTAGGESSTPVATGVLLPAYTDIGLSNSTTYYYKVKGVNVAGTSGYSNEASATTASPIVANGTYKFVDVPGYALDDPSGGGSGTGVDQVTYSGTNQQWTVTNVSGNQYEITAANGLALTGPTIETQLILASYTGASNQLWTFSPNGSYWNVTNVGTGESIDDWGGGSGVTVGQYDADSTNTNQLWTIVAPSTVVNGTYTLTPQSATGLRLYAAGTTAGSTVKIKTKPVPITSRYQWIFTNQGSNLYKIQYAATGLCLDVYQGGTTDGTGIDLWTDNGQTNQRWTPILVSGTNIYKLAPQNAPGEVLDSGGTTTGTACVLWNDYGGTNQQWAVGTN